MTDILDDPFTQPIDLVHLTGNKRYFAPCPCAGGERKLHTRMTTFIKAIADNIALETWKIRQTLEGLAIDETLYLAVCAAMQRKPPAGDTEGMKVWKKEMNSIAYRAQERAGANEGATRGTAFHHFSEALDTTGCTHFVPSWIKPKLVNYAKALEDVDLQVLPEFVERKVHNSRFEVIGTLDRLLLDMRTGLYVVADLKSTREIWTGSEWSMQQAGYANAEHMWDQHAQEWMPMPDPIDRTKAIIIWMPNVHPEGNDAVTIEEIKIERAYDHALQVCADARAWRNEAKTLLSRRPS